MAETPAWGDIRETLEGVSAQLLLGHWGHMLAQHQRDMKPCHPEGASKAPRQAVRPRPGVLPERRGQHPHPGGSWARVLCGLQSLGAKNIRATSAVEDNAAAITRDSRLLRPSLAHSRHTHWRRGLPASAPRPENETPSSGAELKWGTRRSWRVSEGGGRPGVEHGHSLTRPLTAQVTASRPRSHLPYSDLSWWKPGLPGHQT